MGIVRHVHQPVVVSKKSIGRRNHQNQVTANRFYFLIQNVRSKIIKAGVTIRYHKIDDSAGFSVEWNYWKPTINHLIHLEICTSHPEMVPFGCLHTLLKPDMELELELSLIFGQKHSEKNQQICLVLLGLYVPFNGRSQGGFSNFGDLQGWWSTPRLPSRETRETCHIPNGKLGKSSISQRYHGLGIWGYVSFEEGY